MTAQVRERITIDNFLYGMISEPLEIYLCKNFYGKLDGVYPRLEEFSTACWRGYIGHWIIEDNQLYLINLTNDYHEPVGNYDGIPRIFVRVGDDDLRVMADWRKSFFNGIEGNIKADWYSGDLVIEMGEQIEYVHQAYASKYEKYMIMQIENGNLISKKIVNEKPRYE